MQENNYRLTLFNTHWKEDFLTYDFPLLPNQGDIIEVIKESELFLVKDRGFSINNNEDLIEVTLYGTMENDDHQTRLSWDRFKERLPKKFQIKYRPIEDYNLDDLDL